MFAILHNNNIVRDGSVFMIFDTEHDAIATLQNTYSKLGKVKLAPESKMRQKVFTTPDGEKYSIQFLQVISAPTHF